MTADPLIALSGGVGGAKLVLGLARCLPAEELLVVANTGDDFEHLGLVICPDIDTLVYTLAGLSNRETGWGRAGDTAGCMTALAALGGPTWFFLGDGDLALHLERTRRLHAGEGLSRVTADLAGRLGAGTAIVPMSEDPVRTIIRTAAGALPFQHYFVRERCAPAVTGFDFVGAERARPEPRFMQALTTGRARGVVLCPSNPFTSLDPILALPGIREALAGAAMPVIAVSPVVRGRALKGPTAKMMQELGLAQGALTVAERYRDILDGFVLDNADADLAEAVAALGIAPLVTGTVMTSLADRVALAGAVVAFLDRLRGTA